MKSFLLKLRWPLALVSILILGACGGSSLTSGYTTMAISGTISGLNYDGLVLLDNGTDAIAPAASATTFAFPTEVKVGSTYNITVKTQPSHETCTIASPTDTVGRTTTISVAVVCAQNTYTVGGTVSNLTTDGLVLTNGTDYLSVSSGATSFTMGTAVADLATYGVTVWNNPTGQSCTVTNGTGRINGAAVSDVVVTCI
jgi:hypothetical protein